MKKSRLFLMIVFIATFAIFGCSSTDNGNNTNADTTEANTDEVTPESKTIEINLADKGIPVTVTAPTGSEVKKGIANGEFDGVKFMNYYITKDDFILDAMMEDSDLESSVTELLADSKQLAQEEDGFSEIVKEETNGFIYKLKADGADDYNFCYILIKDKRAIEFSAGLKFSEFSLENIEILYEAAKNAK